ncbi:MAG: hypothetical protein ISS63_14925 [Desulfobacteraceae bacterium]|nr:hypothetical protein [Desulfobacteraceae bacterium]
MAPKMAGLIDLIEYFSNPISQRQKQYEAVRAVVLETQPSEIVAKTFGYKTSTIYSLIRDAKSGKIKLFPIIKKGPQQRRTSPEVQKRVIVLRKQGLSSPDIQSSLAEEGIKRSTKTVERILKDKGFGKLKRRTNKQLGKSITRKILPDRAGLLDFSELEPFNIDCPSVPRWPLQNTPPMAGSKYPSDRLK